MAAVSTAELVRATPPNPMPGVTKDASIPSSEGRNLPPELGTDAIAILEGRTFMYSDSVGDVPGGAIGGLVHADTRFLNRWVLTINGKRFLALRSGRVDHYSASFFLANDQMPGLMPNTIAVRRLRYVGHGMHERIELQSFSAKPLSIELRLAAGNDFADLFEIKDRVRDRSAEITRQHAMCHEQRFLLVKPRMNVELDRARIGRACDAGYEHDLFVCIDRRGLQGRNQRAHAEHAKRVAPQVLHDRSLHDDNSGQRRALRYRGGHAVVLVRFTHD